MCATSNSGCWFVVHLRDQPHTHFCFLVVAAGQTSSVLNSMRDQNASLLHQENVLFAFSIVKNDWKEMLQMCDFSRLLH